jgi:two-component system, cell cycle sensor histidine kinase DivJ
VQSRIDEGTTVTVALPLAFARAPQPSSNVEKLIPATRSATHDPVYQVKKRA